MNHINKPKIATNALITTKMTSEVFVQTYAMTKDQAHLIKKSIAKSCTMDEFFTFLTQAKMTGLNPFKNQCRPVVRGSGNDRIMTFQTGIDGYRAIAHRSGAYAGQDEIEYDTMDGEHPQVAKITVYKFVQGQKVAFPAIARWDEYLPSLPKMQFMWKKMPWLMLGKVAEALALRKAFPEDLGGIFIEEEMGAAMGTEIKADFEPIEEEPIIEEPQKPDLKKAKAKKEEKDDKKAESSGTDQKTETKEASDLDPMKMDRGTLSKWLKKQSGKRYNTDIFEKIKSETFGNTLYKNITLKGFQNFYEKLEETARVGS